MTATMMMAPSAALGSDDSSGVRKAMVMTITPAVNITAALRGQG